MLDPYLDFRVVQGKVEEALKLKLKEMYPCSADKWRLFLKEFGIIFDAPPERYMSGFFRVADPMRGKIIDGQGRFVGEWGGVLHMPDEVVEKILALGGLP